MSTSTTTTIHQQQSSSSPSPTEHFSIEKFRESLSKAPLTIVVVGASGHLARTEVIPNLFSLYTRKVLPENFTIVGYARTKKTDEEFQKDVKQAIESRHIITDVEAVTGEETSDPHNKGKWFANAKAFLTRKKSNANTKATTSKDDSTPKEREHASDDDLINVFVSHCIYRSGQYDSEEDFRDLGIVLREKEDSRRQKDNNNSQVEYDTSTDHPIHANRLWHLAIPPSEFEGALKGIHSLAAPVPTCFQRIAIEKPFGKDLEGAQKLNKLIASMFDEKDIFRVDHFLEKEWVQQLFVLRFANPMFANSWSKENIEYIVVNIKETKSVEGRGQYFDEVGVLGDMIQNHLLEILSIVAIDEPAAANVQEFHSKKIAFLKCISPLNREDVVLGQYSGDDEHPSYQDEESVPKNSKAESQATCIAYINNETWKGVPVILNTGKGLNESKSELRIVFKSRKQPSIYASAAHNEIRVNISEPPHINLTINKKRIGVTHETEPITLSAASEQDVTPMNAYERLMLDLLRGDHRSFVTGEESVATWRVVDELKRSLRQEAITPLPYKFGSPGPEQINELFRKHNIPLTREEL